MHILIVPFNFTPNKLYSDFISFFLTIFSMQLCVSVQIPACFEGLQSEAIYVDTNSNFSQLRLTGMLMYVQVCTLRINYPFMYN